jgi:anti-anti-sigma regulatory factor
VKLSLGLTQGFTVLKVDAEVSAHDFQVLKAGITKLLGDGKDKIVLDLTPQQDMDEAMIRELGLLNFTARELSGEIVLIASAKGLLQKIESFANPKPISIYGKVEEGVEHLVRKGKVASELSGAPVGASPEEIQKLQAEITQLKGQLRDKEGGGELAQVKQQNAELAAQNRQLMEQVEAMFLKRVEPPNAASYQEKVTLLEDKVEELLKKIEESQAPAKK